MTLLETLLAVSLLVTLMGMTFWFYNSTLDTREDGLDRARNIQLARVVLQRMADEVRLASGNTNGYGPGLVGYAGGFSVNTLVLPDRIVSAKRDITDDAIAAQFDLQEVSYYVAWDEENLDENGDPRSLGLVRKVSKTYNRGIFIQREDDEEDIEDEEALSVKEELYAPEIKFLEVRYFDGATWWEDWQINEGNSLPMLVRITVGFTPVLPEEEDEFDLVDDDFLRDESEREPIPADQFTLFVRPVQADTSPLGVRLQREASAFSASEGGF